MRTVTAFLQALPAQLAEHPRLMGFALAAVFIGLAVGIAALTSFVRDLRECPARGRAWPRATDRRDVEDHLRALRIQADDAHMTTWRGGATHPAGLYPKVLVDQRTAELVVDPTLRPADVAEMVEHVAHGVGSVASVAAEAEDTTLRGPLALARLQAAEVAAYDEAFAREFIGFDEAVAAAFARLDRLQWQAGAWSFYAHNAEGHACPHCTDAVSELTGEYAELTARVLAESTQAMDVRALRAELAAA